MPMSNAAEMLARVEQIIDVLRTCGFALDEERAQRTLRYFRGEEPGDAAEQAAIAFLGDHGQSLDWVFTGDPGVMIAMGASEALAS